MRNLYDNAMPQKLSLRKENFTTISSDTALLKQKRKYFVGNVALYDISSKLMINDQKVYLAGFKNGARTKLHYHQGDQTLIVTHGNGILELFKKTSSKNKPIKIKLVKKTSLKLGDIVLVPRQTLHWHGARKGHTFAHIALNAFYKGNESKTIWFESDFSSNAIKID